MIAQSCNRFWLVDNGELSEWHNLDALYRQLSAEESDHIHSETVPIEDISPHYQKADILLERLVMLEKDLIRKEKHQKTQLQQQWRQEINFLNKKLAI